MPHRQIVIDPLSSQALTGLRILDIHGLEAAAEPTA